MDLIDRYLEIKNCLIRHLKKKIMNVLYLEISTIYSFQNQSTNLPFDFLFNRC